MRYNRIRWFVYVMRKDNLEAVRDILEKNIDRKRGRGIPKKMWWDKIDNNMRICV